MRKLLLVFVSTVLALSASAIPAMRGIKRIITLENGNRIEVELKGDEFVHFWQSEDGSCYVKEGEHYVLAEREYIAQLAAERRKSFLGTEVRRSPDKKARILQKPFFGKKKGLIILVEFADKKFSMQDPQQYYDRMTNEPSYRGEIQEGSLYDYFLEQSNGQFHLQFDVYGPVVLPQSYAYYGADNGTKQDEHVDDMICSAVNSAAKVLNLADYDWDGDGEVEQVFVLYAGEGQASSGDENTIWPHKWNISNRAYSGYKPLQFGNITVDVYACSNEMVSGKVAGIGAICHEFSHCLGLPDTYDTSQNTVQNYGMGSWDLMSSGNYNGAGYIPAGYNSWQKWQAGWIAPIELNHNVVSEMKPLTQGGEAYIVYNPANKDEYFMVENRKKEGFDRSLPGEGMLILHVDYNEKFFSTYNCPNAFAYGNDRERFTLLPADNVRSSGSEENDAFPQFNVSAVTRFTTPSPVWFCPNKESSYDAEFRMTRIVRDEEGRISFVFGDATKANAHVLFSETFDDCNSTGANDDNWSTFKVAAGVFRSDVEGWEAIKKYGGSHCARFGTGASDATVSTPAFEVNGEAELSFRAAPFSNSVSLTLGLTSDNPDVKLTETSFQLIAKQWTDFKVRLNGKGKVRLNFTLDSPFYLDELMVLDLSSDAVSGVPADGLNIQQGTYNLQGQRVEAPQRGLYIRNGKKVVLR